MGHGYQSSTIVDALSTPVEQDADMLVLMDKAMEFAKRLKAACVAAGVPELPNALSRATKGNLSPALCHKYLNGQTKLENISATNLYYLSRTLKVSLRWLLTGDGHPSYRLPENDIQNEVVVLMQTLPEESQRMALRVVRGLVSEEKSAPITGRFQPPTPR